MIARPLIQETERDVQRAILDWANTVLPGFKLWRQNTGATVAEHKGRRRFIRFGVPGQSDLTGIGPGGIRVEIEVKRPGGTVTDAQAQWLIRIHESGGIAFFAHSLDMCIGRMREAFEARGWAWKKEWEL